MLEDETLFNQGDEGNKAYMIVAGKLSVEVDKNEVGFMSDGEVFGELALFDDEPRSANAIATENTQLLGFFTQDLMTLQERNPVLGQKILFNLGGLLGKRLRKTNALLVKEQTKK